MFFDEQVAKPVTTDPFSLESLIAWLEKQPCDQWYAWACAGECLIGQWLHSIDRNSHPDDNGGSFGYIVYGEPVDLTRYDSIALDGKSTFGAALERARTIAAR